MGKREETVAIGVGGKNIQLRSCQTHHVGISPQEDRGGTKGTLGKGQGAAEEGGVGQAAQVITEDGADSRLETLVELLSA